MPLPPKVLELKVGATTAFLDIEFFYPLASTSQVLGLQVCTPPGGPAHSVQGMELRASRQRQAFYQLSYILTS